MTAALPTPAEAPTVTVDAAAEALGISRDVAYKAISAGTFPVPVIRASARRLVVPTAALRALLQLDPEPTP